MDKLSLTDAKIHSREERSHVSCCWFNKWAVFLTHISKTQIAILEFVLYDRNKTCICDVKWFVYGLASELLCTYKFSAALKIYKRKHLLSVNSSWTACTRQGGNGKVASRWLIHVYPTSYKIHGSCYWMFCV